jgi:hypothetical protein
MFDIEVRSLPENVQIEHPYLDVANPDGFSRPVLIIPLVQNSYYRDTDGDKPRHILGLLLVASKMWPGALNVLKWYLTVQCPK